MNIGNEWISQSMKMRIRPLLKIKLGGYNKVALHFFSKTIWRGSQPKKGINKAHDSGRADKTSGWSRWWRWRRGCWERWNRPGYWQRGWSLNWGLDITAWEIGLAMHTITPVMLSYVHLELCRSGCNLFLASIQSEENKLVFCQNSVQAFGWLQPCSFLCTHEENL